MRDSKPPGDVVKLLEAVVRCFWTPEGYRDSM
jgi:hypothetical protein